MTKTLGELERASTRATPSDSPQIRLPDDYIEAAGDKNAERDAVPIAPTRQPAQTTVNRIKTLEAMGTNFIFPFGVSASGKTVAMSALIHHMSSANSGGKLHAWDSPYGSADDTHRYIREVNKMFASKKFPSRTMFLGSEWDRTRHVNVFFAPNDKARPKMKLTFVDMAGDDHESFSERDQQLPQSIEIYFQANKLSLTFLLVARHQDAARDDEKMVSFLNHIIRRDPRFENARVLILISNWDTFGGDDTVEEFVEKHMPQTYSKTLSPSNAMISFSVGAVGQIEDDGKPEVFLREFNPEPSRKVTAWLYRSFTGKPLVKIPWWKKFV